MLPLFKSDIQTIKKRFCFPLFAFVLVIYFLFQRYCRYFGYFVGFWFFFFFQNRIFSLAIWKSDWLQLLVKLGEFVCGEVCVEKLLLLRLSAS